MPHVHVVANNTNIVTEQRLQNPASKELKHSLRAWSGSEDSRTSTAPRRRRPCTGTCSSARCSPSTCAVRSERSPRRAATPGWRIRARIRVARSVTRGGDEFRRLLKNLGVEAEDNSIKARQRDWVFSLTNHPTWYVSGESLGLSYGRESLMRGFSLGAA